MITWRDTLSLEELRASVYAYFDTTLKPLIMAEEDDIVKKCSELANNQKFKIKLKWIVKKYENTVRISAFSLGYGYRFFMIATPEGKEEYDFTSDYEFYGSRKADNK